VCADRLAESLLQAFFLRPLGDQPLEVSFLRVN
jgi:hypothetical protein